MNEHRLISPDEFEAEQAEEAKVFEEFGFAVYSAQRLENHMTMALGLALVINGQYKTLNEATNGVLKIQRVTMGSVLTWLDPHLESAWLKEQLFLAKLKRNHLAHQFFREHEGDELSSAGRVAMIRECIDLSEFFNELTNKWLTPIVRAKLELIEAAPEDYVPGLGAEVERRIRDIER